MTRTPCVARDSVGISSRPVRMVWLFFDIATSSPTCPEPVEGPFSIMNLKNDARFMLLGGTYVGEAALLRFYVLHCVAFPFLAGVFMIVHFWRIRKDGFSAAPMDLKDKNEEIWTGGVTKDIITRFDTKTATFVEYLLPKSTNIRRVSVDNTTTPVTFWVGNNHKASIVKLEPLQ